MIFYLIFILQLFSILLWGFLIKTYSIFKYYDTPYFAMDKIVGHFDSPIIQRTLLAFIAISIIYLINLFLIKKIKNHLLQLLFVFIILIGIVLPIFIYPIGAIDVFDYIAQGKLFYFYHQNPYIASYSLYPNDIFWKFAGFLDQNLIYGPVWLLSVFIPNLFINYTDYAYILNSLISYKAFNLVLLLLTGFYITKLHKSKSEKIFSWYLFVGNPFVLFEVLSNGHNDILIALFLVLATIFYNKKPHITCLFIALASLVKIYFLVLIPLVLLRLLINKYNTKQIIKSILYSLITILLFYLPFILNNTKQVINSVYNSQNMNTYSVFSLIRENLILNNYPQNNIYLVQIILFFVFLLISILIIFKTRRASIALSMVLIINLFVVLLTLSHPWYFVVSIALISCSRQKLVNSLTISAITLFLLCFYPLSVWLWFNSGFNVSQIHLAQSALIVPVVVVSTILSYIFRNQKI